MISDEAREVPAWGTIARAEADDFHRRQQLAGVRDLSSPAHREVVRMREEMGAACERKHGRRPSLNPFQHSDQSVIAALDALEVLESVFIHATSDPAVSAEDVEAAHQEYHQALLKFANVACAGWESAADFERAEARRRRTW